MALPCSTPANLLLFPQTPTLSAVQRKLKERRRQKEGKREVRAGKQPEYESEPEPAPKSASRANKSDAVGTPAGQFKASGRAVVPDGATIRTPCQRCAKMFSQFPDLVCWQKASRCGDCSNKSHGCEKVRILPFACVFPTNPESVARQHGQPP